MEDIESHGFGDEAVGLLRSLVGCQNTPIEFGGGKYWLTVQEKGGKISVAVILREVPEGREGDVADTVMYFVYDVSDGRLLSGGESADLSLISSFLNGIAFLGQERTLDANEIATLYSLVGENVRVYFDGIEFTLTVRNNGGYFNFSAIAEGQGRTHFIVDSTTGQFVTLGGNINFIRAFLKGYQPAIDETLRPSESLSPDETLTTEEVLILEELQGSEGSGLQLEGDLDHTYFIAVSGDENVITLYLEREVDGFNVINCEYDHRTRKLTIHYGNPQFIHEFIIGMGKVLRELLGEDHDPSA